MIVAFVMYQPANQPTNQPVLGVPGTAPSRHHFIRSERRGLDVQAEEEQNSAHSLELIWNFN